MNQITITMRIGDHDISLEVPEDQREPHDRISCWWGVTTSAIALSRFILENHKCEGLDVLELGSGIGLAGVAACLAGANVAFSDNVPLALEFCRRNCILNGIDPYRARFLDLDWENPDDLQKYDIIMGAEILYDYYMHKPLLSLIDKLTAANGAVLLADRPRLVVSRFIGEMIGKEFICNKTTRLVNKQGFPKQQVSVFELSRSGQGRV
jgi:predicted nicotinamide N-methyase